jgi:antitoxin CptB
MDEKSSSTGRNEVLTKSQLRWRCRRGMLELDYLLQNYLEEHYSLSSPQELASFQKLLDTPDNLLLEYLLGTTLPIDPGFQDVVKKIRAAVVY